MDAYRTLVKSLKRLYSSVPKKVSIEKLQSMLEEEKISSEEFEYITTD